MCGYSGQKLQENLPHNFVEFSFLLPDYPTSELENEVSGIIYGVRPHTLQAVVHRCITFHRGKAESAGHVWRVPVYIKQKN